LSAYPDGLLQLFKDVVGIAELRSLPGGQNLSGEMLLMLARVVFEDYKLFPNNVEHKVERDDA
jgi:hypothetical protein